MSTLAELYDRARNESLPATERDLARRQADAATHNTCFYTGPSLLDREMREAGRMVFCSPCGAEREICGHPQSYGADDSSLRRCERHGGRSQTECNVFEVVGCEHAS